VTGGDVLAEESGGEPAIGGVIDEAPCAVGADFADARVPGFRGAELLGRRTGDESGESFGMVEGQGQADRSGDRDSAVGEGFHPELGEGLDDTGSQRFDRHRGGRLGEEITGGEGVSGQVGEVDLEIIGQTRGHGRPQRHPGAQGVAEDEDGGTGIVVEGTDGDAHGGSLRTESANGFRLDTTVVDELDSTGKLCRDRSGVSR
jgi:hypothetical protein